ncbi:MAG: hypothetical protein PHF00_01300 [Elusimicrobia bacterium]|nr:hypothetical protein [Elusimicrobiota bacterium]
MTRRIFYGVLGAACLVQAWLAFGYPVGLFQDDALHILLARALEHFSFALPGRAPAADPLPGMAAILALPVRLAGSHFGWLRWIPLAAGWVAVFLSFRLLRRVLPETLAMLGAVLTAFNPTLLENAGIVRPDLVFLAAALAAFDALASGALAWAALWAALAGMLRPHGALLIAACGAALWLRGGRRRAMVWTAAAGLPLAVWSLRNLLAAGTASDYVSNLGLRLSAAGPWQWAAALADIFGKGLLAVPGGSWAAPAIIIPGAVGAVRLSRTCPGSWTLAAALYAGGFVLLQAAWGVADPRYVLALLPMAWLFALAAAGSSRTRPAAVAAALCLAAGASADAGLLRARRARAELWPRTLAWIRAATPPQARFQTMFPMPVMLLTDRQAFEPPLAFNRDSWLAFCLSERIDYLHLDRAVGRWSTLPAPRRAVLRELPRWAASTPYAAEVYRDEGEGSAIFRLAQPEPARYLKGFARYLSALDALASGAEPKTVRAGLLEAAALEPRLALPWAMLGHLASDAKEKRECLAKALRLDPTLDAARAELSGL